MRLAMKRWLCLVALPMLCAQGSLEAAAQRTMLFEYHSGFWINLHHFLYRQAQVLLPQTGPHPLDLTKTDKDELERLSANERSAWNEAVSYYSRSVVQRDLLFDRDLVRIKDELEDAEATADLEGAEIPAELKAALLKATPIYRKHWWARHDAENHQWIAHLEPLVQHGGPALSTKLSIIYGEPWPGYPVRVDVVTYANWSGAYTSLRPTRPTISSTDRGNQEMAALEILFHETSHGMMDKVMDALKSAEARVNVTRAGAPFHAGSIWHAVLFYTAGELVAEQTPGYTPYADKAGLWVRAWPAPDRALIERDWKPHMNGSVSLEQSLAKLVQDLASAPLAR